MGSALLGGMIGSGAFGAAELGVVELVESRRDELAATFPGVRVSAEPVPCRSAILAVKPPDAAAAAPPVVEAGATRLLSIAAGVRIGDAQIGGRVRRRRGPGDAEHASPGWSGRGSDRRRCRRLVRQTSNGPPGFSARSARSRSCRAVLDAFTASPARAGISVPGGRGLIDSAVAEGSNVRWPSGWSVNYCSVRRAARS